MPAAYCIDYIILQQVIQERICNMTKTVINNWDKLPVILDLNTVALIFGVTEVTIKKLLYNGELKGKKLGKKWVFDKEYIKNYAQVQSDKAV